MASGFQTWSQTAASNGAADDSIDWAEGQAPSSVNDSARAMMAVLAKHRDDVAGTLTTGGTSTAYTLTTNTVFASAASMNGQTLRVKMSATNGASPTLNVDGQGAAEIVTATGTAIATGALVSGQIYDFTYLSSSSEWLVVGSFGVVGSDAVATGSIQSNAVTDAKLRDSTALSVIGRASNSSGDPADIAAGSDNAVLRRSGTSIGFGTIGGSSIDAGAIAYSKLDSGVTATQAQQEAASTTQSFVTPGTQHHHPSAAKAWVVFTGASGAVQASRNVSSVTRNASGDYTVAVTTNFSSDAYTVTPTIIDGGAHGFIRAESQSASGFTIKVRNSADSGSFDPSRISVVCFGDL